MGRRKHQEAVILAVCLSLIKRVIYSATGLAQVSFRFANSSGVVTTRNMYELDELVFDAV